MRRKPCTRRMTGRNTAPRSAPDDMEVRPLRSLISALMLTAPLAFTAAATPCVAQQYHQVAQWDLHATGGFDYLTYSPADHRLYVTQANQVVVLDATSGKVLGDITGLEHTHDVVLDPDGRTGYITDGGAGKVV